MNRDPLTLFLIGALVLAVVAAAITDQLDPVTAVLAVVLAVLLLTGEGKR